MNYQKTILVGNATKDAEKQTSKDGKVKYTTFRLGVSDGKENTTFFPVTVFGKLGESVAEYITKGRQVLVDGRVQIGDNGRCKIARIRRKRSPIPSDADHPFRLIAITRVRPTLATKAYR